MGWLCALGPWVLILNRKPAFQNWILPVLLSREPGKVFNGVAVLLGATGLVAGIVW